MKKIYIMVGILILGITAYVYSQVKSPVAEESITYFPIAPNVNFTSARTSLSLIKPSSLLWTIDSTLDRKAYLRQDAGFLYSNGRLIGELGNWKQNTSRLLQEKPIPIKDSSLFQAITFHQGELHENDTPIYSSQALSDDYLYVIHQDNTNRSFHSPKTKEQTEWKQKLDEQTERMLQYSWNKGIRHFTIHLDDYQVIPLTLFSKNAKSSLSGFSKAASAQIVGQLWEGLYKNYFLGIKKADGTIVSPIGSTLPLILLAKNKSHLLVLTETVNGEPILLRQMIE
ncbi:hypothetical protein AA0X95_10965 [Bacillus sp. 1P10SD]|uniref:hypothetical protein n=1 Tax=Bacillus sp. 1P10SD TaxID=3132265 RepID=UPI0039A5F87F